MTTLIRTENKWAVRASENLVLSAYYGNDSRIRIMLNTNHCLKAVVNEESKQYTVYIPQDAIDDGSVKISPSFINGEIPMPTQ